ncbi:MAG: hypothetical protein AUG83_04530 [Acidobacteria bacterium 13_1_20CM_4_57_11]|nr:MAG: hypothetical protein AUG83_04530 [Acidobacteria bacterium 13_1_20CM_4_57_11]
MAEKEKIAALIPHGKSSAEKEPPSRRSSYSTATLVADEREGFPDLQSLAKPENEVARTESLLDLQQSRGNYYVQKAIAEYRQRTAIEPPGPKEVATTKLAATTSARVSAPTTMADKAAPTSAFATVPVGGPQSAASPPVVIQPEDKAPKVAPTPGHLPLVAGKAVGGPAPTKIAVPSAGGTTLENWKAGIHGATAGLKTGKISAAPHVASLQKSGATAIGKRQTETQKLPKDGKAAVTPPPKANAETTLIPPKVDPVPEATKVVETKVNKTLPAQTMPPFEESPQHNMPQIGPAPAPAPPSKAEDDKSKADADKKPAVDPGAKDPKKEQADKLNAPQKKEEGPIHRGPRGEIIIEDKEGPPKQEPEIPRPFKVGIAAALARLMADPRSEADAVLKQVRDTAYNGALPGTFPDIGKSSLEELTASLKAELDGIGKEAGISEQEINDAVAKRQQEIEKEKAEAQGQVANAGDAEKQKLAKAGTDALSVIAGTREEVDKATEEKLAQAKGDNDPEVLKLTRERLIRESQKKVARKVVSADAAGKKRHDEINQIANLQRIAYRNAVRLDLQKVDQLAGGDAGKAYPWNLVAAASRNWGDSEQRKIDQLLVDKGKETDSFVLDLQKGVRAAGERANELIRAWADGKLNEHRSFWQELWQKFSDWSAQAKAESEAWETSRNQATRDAMVGDMNFLGGVIITAGDQLSEESRKNLDKLSAEQRAIVSTYYGLGPDGNPIANAKDAKNPFAAIAAGLRIRILQERGPSIMEKFEKELADTPASDWDKLNVLGMAQGGPDAAKVCSEIHEALHGGLFGWNDEARVFRALAGMGKVQAMAARKLYSLPPSSGGYDKDLDADIHSQLGGAERTRAEALLTGDRALADVAALREAMHGGLTGWGTDEKAIMDTLRGKSAAERDKIKQLYFEKYGLKLDDDIKEELTGLFEDEHDYARSQALMEGDTDKADGIAIDQAMYGGLTGWGTDRKAIEDVYQQVRQDVERELQEERRRTNKPPLTTKELEVEVKRRYEQIEASYNATYKDKWGEGDESALRRAYKDELSDGELALVNAIADNDLTKADAARIQVEKESIVYADDEIINGVLKHQYERALEELKRDKEPALQADLEKRRAEAAKTGHPWDYYRLKQEQHKLDQQLEEEAKKESKQYMNQLENTYDTDFGSIGKGSLRYELEKNMDGYELEEARKRVAQGGWLTPAQEIHFATEGLGTKDQAFSKALEGKTKEEIEEIRKEWKKLHPGESLDDRIDSETSGRLNFELHHKLMGEPMSMKEEMENMDDLVQHEREHWSAGSYVFAGDESKRMEFRYKEMKEKYDAANDPKLTDEQRARKIAEFQRFAGYTNVSVQEHKESMESITNSLVTAVTTAIAVVVAAVCIAVTAGAATGPIAVAFAGWASSAAGAATIALGTAAVGITIKGAMLGADYGIEDAGVDLAVGGVDAAVAAATAGLSKVVMTSAAERFVESLGKNFTVAERQALIAALEENPKFAKGLLASMAQSASRPTRMFAHAATGAFFGALGSGTSGAARSFLDSKTWENGSAWEKILEGTTSGMKQGVVVGAAMGMVGGIAKPHAPGKVPMVEETGVRRPTEKDLIAPGQQHTSETLKEGLPPDLRKKVPVSVDPDLEGNTVRVHYGVDENGVIKDIHIRAGPSATPRDIELHVQTVRTMQKYTGLQGRVRAVIAKARALVTKKSIVPGTRSFEALHEVEKLPHIIDEQMQALADPELDPKARADIEARVEHLQDQLNEHQSILEGAMPEEEARGYVAAEGRKKGAAETAEPEEKVAPEPTKKAPPTEETAKAPAPKETTKTPLVAEPTEVPVEEDIPVAGAKKQQTRTEARKELRGVRRRIQELSAKQQELESRLDEEGQLSNSDFRLLRDAEYEIGLLRSKEDKLAATLGQEELNPEQLAKQKEMIEKYLAENPDKHLKLIKPNEETRALLAELEEISGGEPDPLDRLLAAIRGTYRDKTFKDAMVPAMRKMMPKDTVFSTQDWRQFKAILGLDKLPWPGGIGGPDLFFVDVANRRIQPVEI